MCLFWIGLICVKPNNIFWPLFIFFFSFQLFVNVLEWKHSDKHSIILKEQNKEVQLQFIHFIFKIPFPTLFFPKKGCVFILEELVTKHQYEEALTAVPEFFIRELVAPEVYESLILGLKVQVFIFFSDFLCFHVFDSFVISIWFVRLFWQLHVILPTLPHFKQKENKFSLKQMRNFQPWK